VNRKPRKTSNTRALEVTLTELALIGRLERIDSAHVQAARSMAAELDLHPGRASLWREYHVAIERLRADDAGSDELDDLLEELSTEVRNSAQT
jgi:hypothetical protein